MPLTHPRTMRVYIETSMASTRRAEKRVEAYVAVAEWRGGVVAGLC